MVVIRSQSGERAVRRTRVEAIEGEEVAAF